jgi:hypothetical protein
VIHDTGKFADILATRGFPEFALIHAQRFTDPIAVLKVTWLGKLKVGWLKNFQPAAYVP